MPGIKFKLPELESWFLANDETLEEFQGQFPPQEISHEITSSWGEDTALNRQTTILSFLHGNSETISFQARLYALDATDDITKRIRMLFGWVKRDPNLKRPPILQFWIGNAAVSFRRCILEAVTGIVYHSFRNDGSPRDVEFTLNLREYHPYEFVFQLAGGSTSNTRYHRARLHDYYEWLAQREYNDPMRGIEIRNSHPEKPNLQPADVVVLPSKENLSTGSPAPSSISLSTGFGRADTPQRTLRLETFNNRNRSFTSLIQGD
jgi:hypothetical protein